MPLVKLENGVPTGVIIADSNFRALFPEVNFGPILDPNIVETYGFGLYDYSRPPQCLKYEKPREITPVRDQRGIWMQTWEIAQMNASERAEVDTKQSTFVRNRRNMGLYETDWTQIPDNNLSDSKKAEWTAYRQSLRDITSQSGFPWDVTWPTKPE